MRGSTEDLKILKLRKKCMMFANDERGIKNNQVDVIYIRMQTVRLISWMN